MGEIIKINEAQLKQMINEVIDDLAMSNNNPWEENGEKTKIAVKNLFQKMFNDENFKTMDSQANGQYRTKFIAMYKEICENIDKAIETFVRVSGNQPGGETNNNDF